MNGTRFDILVKSLRFRANRRGVIRLIAGSGLAGVIDLGRADDAAACRKAGKKCEKDTQCCSKTCKKKTCFCRPLGGKCPSPAASHICCPQAGVQPGCNVIDKPECGSPTLGCHLGAGAPCQSTCDCGFDLVCGDAWAPTGPRCCWVPGRACVPGANGQTCCSSQCGCASAAGTCTCRNEGCKNPGPGATCTQTLQCCNGICESGECCLPQGIACTATAQCCAGLFCDGGVCDTP